MAPHGAKSHKKRTPMTASGTGVVTKRPTPAAAGRVDWVDYAKGICIVITLEMQLPLA